MSKFFRHVVTVKRLRSGAQFPIDMLRYDRLSPRTESDSYAIRRADYDDTAGEAIELVHLGPDRKWQPQAGRWQSFGWDVERVAIPEEV